MKPEAHPEPSQTSTLEFFAKIVNDFQPLTIFTKSSISDIRLGSEYVSEKLQGFCKIV